MFGNKKKVDLDATDTLIGEHTVFEGVIRSQASVRVEGQVLGGVECDGDVIVGEPGCMEATSIKARNITVAGLVKGTISAAEKLTLVPTGKLYGDTSAKSLVLEEGSLFEGNCKMEKQESLKVVHTEPETTAKQSQQG